MAFNEACQRTTSVIGHKGLLWFSEKLKPLSAKMGQTFQMEMEGWIRTRVLFRWDNLDYYLLLYGGMTIEKYADFSAVGTSTYCTSMPDKTQHSCIFMIDINQAPRRSARRFSQCLCL